MVTLETLKTLWPPTPPWCCKFFRKIHDQNFCTKIQKICSDIFELEMTCFSPPLGSFSSSSENSSVLERRPFVSTNWDRFKRQCENCESLVGTSLSVADVLILFDILSAALSNNCLWDSALIGNTRKEVSSPFESYFCITNIFPTTNFKSCSIELLILVFSYLAILRIDCPKLIDSILVDFSFKSVKLYLWASAFA